ncbi:hypothetical protein FOL47_003042 [Perkinsus chesapeaki]|uniref:subtilisin n=1 Tax=Perkinsus chesapeaki TaxID=330153 RepID=A0A7J6MB54_PERCH|nr:hypothetical protein FOL47_003042 [Perkinsus chesapeaki]
MFTHLFAFGYVAVWVTGLREAEQPPLQVTAKVLVNDPLYKKQLPYLQAIGVPSAWERLVSTRVRREKVTVAVIDSGVQSDHPDLVANVIKGYNVIDHNGDTHDRNGHGTAMAGVLGATLNNSIGLAGVADLVNIMPIFYGEPPSFASMTGAIDYVIRQKHVKIILMASSANASPGTFTAKVKEADAAGILTIVTAGNEGKNITTDRRFPCAFTTQLKGMLCVTATGVSNMRLDADSNFANYLDIAAPGTDIVSTVMNGGYSYVGGTSAAAAIVAGVAAMLYSLAPTLMPADAKKILKDTAKNGVKDSSGRRVFPFGRIDADKAVAKLLPRKL